MSDPSTFAGDDPPFTIYDPSASYFSLHLNDREILKLNHDGTVEIADHLSYDEVAIAFWDAVKAQVPEYFPGASVLTIEYRDRSAS